MHVPVMAVTSNHIKTVIASVLSAAGSPQSLCIALFDALDNIPVASPVAIASGLSGVADAWRHCDSFTNTLRQQDLPAGNASDSLADSGPEESPATPLPWRARRSPWASVDKGHLCRRHARSGFCKFGEACRFLHNPASNNSMHPVAKHNESEVDDGSASASHFTTLEFAEVADFPAYKVLAKEASSESVLVPLSVVPSFPCGAKQESEVAVWSNESNSKADGEVHKLNTDEESNAKNYMESNVKNDEKSTNQSYMMPGEVPHTSDDDETDNEMISCVVKHVGSTALFEESMQEMLCEDEKLNVETASETFEEALENALGEPGGLNVGKVLDYLKPSRVTLSDELGIHDHIQDEVTLGAAVQDDGGDAAHASRVTSTIDLPSCRLAFLEMPSREEVEAYLRHSGWEATKPQNLDTFVAEHIRASSLAGCCCHDNFEALAKELTGYNMLKHTGPC